MGKINELVQYGNSKWVIGTFEHKDHPGILWENCSEKGEWGDEKGVRKTEIISILFWINDVLISNLISRFLQKRINRIEYGSMI